MNIDLEMHEGLPEKPVVILIHGLGMNRHFWGNPEKCSAFGGMGNLTPLLAMAPSGDQPDRLTAGPPNPDFEGLAIRLKREGYSTCAWSQRRPVGPISDALDEMAVIMERVHSSWPDKPVYLIGHSRGGLVARMVLDTAPENLGIAGLVTICSPHMGSRMAEFVKWIRPAASLLERILPDEAQTLGVKALERFSNFLKSPAIKELAPGSQLIRSLGGSSPPPVPSLSFGGTDPVLLRLYLRLNSRNKWRELPLPDLLLKAVPRKALPPELVSGRGDALVTAQSARLPGARHLDFHLNHVHAAFSHAIYCEILKFLEEKRNRPQGC